MKDINMANRACCDLDIRDYRTKAPWMFADFCNTTTAGFSSNAVFANKKGAKHIKFDDPMDATISMTFQVHPFRVYSLLSDGEIETEAVIARKETFTATNAGEVELKNTPIVGTVFVYADGDFGGVPIEGSVAGNKFTATSASDIAVDSDYVVAYLENKTTGVQKISFNNKKVPKFFYVQMSTLDKDENGDLVPMRITCYKGSPERTLDLSFSSTGEPAEMTITLTAMEDNEGNVLDMIEIIE